LGEALAGVLEEGDVLVLSGDLGAGKTQLTKGLARGLGIAADVTSPTFTIQMVYDDGRLPLYHFDLYRLESADQLEDTGLFDVLGYDGVCAIEWGEQFADELGDERLDIVLSRLDDELADDDGAGEPARLVSMAPHGERAKAMVATLTDLLG